MDRIETAPAAAPQAEAVEQPDWRIYASGIARYTRAVESLLVRDAGDGVRVLEVWRPDGTRVDYAIPRDPARALGLLLLGEAEPTAALRDVAAERRRQVEVEGYHPAYDDELDVFELASSAASYAVTPERRAHSRPGEPMDAPSIWHLRDLWKPRSDREDLVRAGALVLAAIERIDRADAPAAAEPSEARP